MQINSIIFPQNVLLMHVFTMHSMQYALSMIKAIGILDFRKTSGFFFEVIRTLLDSLYDQR